MKTKIFITLTSLLFTILSAVGQKPSIELIFTAIDNAAYVQLSSIKVINRTQGGDTILYWPDTVLMLNYMVGIHETDTGSEGFRVFQNHPNPVVNRTSISLYVPERDKVSLIITDISGRELIRTEDVLDQGYHSYRFTPGSGSLFFFMAQWRESSSSIKILQGSSFSGHAASLEYLGAEDPSPEVKAAADIQAFPFDLGDELLYIANTGDLQAGMTDAPVSDETYTFQFATNIPCPGTPTVEYEGHIYNTIQIFSQCWLKENLNVGTKINGTHWMGNNGVKEKYCYGNSEDSCAKYGGLYMWNEAMQYSSIQGAQGLCPAGWHMPSDEEWKILEGSVDSFYEIGDDYWDAYQSRGFDAGKNLKSSSGWVNAGNGVDMFGFTALAGGDRGPEGLFYLAGYKGFFWSSTQREDYDKIYRNLSETHDVVQRNHISLLLGLSIRCLKDE